MEELIIQQAETTRQLISMFGYGIVIIVVSFAIGVSMRLNDIGELIKNKKP